METTIPPDQIRFFLRTLLNTILSTRISYDKAFKNLLKRHYFSKWIIPSLYKIGYYTINYYYTLKWLAARQGYTAKPSGVINYFASQGFSIKRVLENIRGELRGLSTTKKLSILYSYPEYVVRDLLKHVDSSELEKMLNSLNTRKRWLRVNFVKYRLEGALKCLDETGVEYERIDFPDYMVYVKKPRWGSIGGNKCVLEGAVVPQDISSALTVEALKPIKQVVLDACSAPGLKLSLMYMLSEKPSFFVAVDYSGKRLVAEQKLLKRLGVDSLRYVLINSDSREVVFRRGFQQALVDAPCSGLGAVYSDPAVKINSPSRSKLEHYHTLQYTILKNTLQYADQVLYATCSIHPLEGELVVEKIVEEGYAEPVEVRVRHLSRGYKGFKVSNKTYRVKPHIVNGQGFFIALLGSLVRRNV